MAKAKELLTHAVLAILVAPLHSWPALLWSLLVSVTSSLWAYFAGIKEPWKIGLITGAAFFLLILALSFARRIWLRKADPQTASPQMAERDLSSYTSAGLNWKIIGHSLVQERAVAILRITSTGELPQPMELAITCLGAIERVIQADLYPNPARPTQRDEDAAIEIPYHKPGQKEVFVTLRAPKLSAPAYLNVHLWSVGSAEIRVLSVKRSPEGWEGTFWKT
jgi:hypothetical protein